MKDMSNRDKMILVVISIIIILVAGFFALIKPQYNKYTEDIDKYNATKSEYDGIQQKLDAIPGLQDTITEIYNGANSDAAVFVNEAFADINGGYSTEKANAAIDEHIQTALDNSNLNVYTLGLAGTSTRQITYYYYTPNVVTYSLLEAADVNGNYASDISELLNRSMLLSQEQSVEVMTNTVTLNVRGTRANLMSFLDEIKSDKNALLVEAVSINDYTFSGGLSDEEPVTEPPATEPATDEEGNPIEAEPTPTPAPTPAGDAVEGEGYSVLDMTVVFYNAKAIDKPVLD